MRFFQVFGDLIEIGGEQQDIKFVDLIIFLVFIMLMFEKWKD